MQRDILQPMPIPPSVFPQYRVIEMSRDQLLALAYTPYDLDAFKIYIIDDTVNKLVMFNMHFRQKGFIESKQYLLTMSQSIDPKRTLLFPIMIFYDFNTDPIQDIPSTYLTVADTDNPASWYIHISSQLKAEKCLFFVNEMAGIFHKIKQIAQKIGQGANWVDQHICKPLKPYIDNLAPPIVSKDRMTNLTNFRNDVGNFIDEPRVRQSIQDNRVLRLHPNVPRNIDRAIGTHLAIPSNQAINDSQYSIQEIDEEDF
ncbi:MAG: hypothetical protein EZS28_013698 [Streblomastix strix]|uniref:Uncharacterized protein n=1 Tax=Streblomastix strix TaxID=222440 RepID=A0A5J4W7U1_9EUKA|nr:MAG: hypothetical protein EZS28_013698 [Streblomastix strix]